MTQLPALVVALEVVKKDPALHPGGSGARKILVTDLYPEREEKATEIEWLPPVGSDKCPVHVVKDIEVASFTQRAFQDRHHHKLGREFYLVLEGEMVIDVEGQPYTLWAGDMIVVNPGAVHQVKPEGTEFTSLVITANYGGAADKYTD